MHIVIIGLSITSSWGNGHATTYRALIRELGRRGHRITFLERDVPWYASHRDFAGLPQTEVCLYQSLEELRHRHRATLAAADAVVVGSYVPEGIAVADWALEHAGGVIAYYDIDTPVTLAAIARGDCDYLTARQIPEFQLFLSFAGGKTLTRLEQEFGSPCARAFHCSVDPELYYPEPAAVEWDLGYLGTYSADRQPGVERLLARPAQAWPQGRFIVAGPQYPAEIRWPGNVARIDHLPPNRHREFYNRQRFTLNITRAEMIAAGHSPSVRLFEAAACGTPIISDRWEGLEEIFNIGSEILVADTTAEALALLRETPPDEAAAIGAAGRARVLAAHTAAHRALELEEAIAAARTRRPIPVNA
jgi:spore maturation protein CgeB